MIRHPGNRAASALVALPLLGLGAVLLPGPSAPAVTGPSAPAVTGPNPRAAAGDVDFERDVLPILGPKCLDCHSGPAPKARLDLLSRANALRGGRSGEAAIVPGEPAKSRLVAVVDGSDAEVAMPPRGAPLAPREVDVLREWIAQGARYSPAADELSGKPWHWAWRPPRAVPVPQVDDAAWSENPIDAFVREAQRRAGLEHAPEAPRDVLARRLSLAVIGLPPTPEEVDRFVADERPDALERYVDRLLASPRYGERMARPWLDLARYADTNGYEKDARRSMWPWRDWVIESFSANVPYDRFVLLQLAGDLLPDATLDSRIATGFHRNTMINEEGGTDPEEFRVEAVHDRVHTTASVFLGATMSCARCHDHKFDPFTIEDYYGFFAFFDGDRADATVLSPHEQRASGAMVNVAPRERRAEYEELVAERDAAVAEIASARPTLAAAQADWERLRAAGASPWSVLRPTQASAESGATLAARPDGTLVVQGPVADVDTYRLTFELEGPVRALRLEVLPDDAPEGQGTGATRGVGRAPNGNFVLNELGAVCVGADKKSGGPVKFARAFADFEQRGGGESWPAEHAIDGKPKTGWAIGPETSRAHELVLVADEPFGAAVQGSSRPDARATLTLTLAQRYGGGHAIARLRLSAASASDEAALAPLAADTAAALARPATERTPEELARIAEHFAAHAPSLAEARARRAAAERAIAGISTATTLVMERAPRPRTTHVHRKGNFLDSGEEVRPAIPPVLGTFPEELPRDRLGLARWIVSEKNPQFARTFVNLLWALDFGRGLVATPEDFGSQGEPPTHPELLDFLAMRFQSTGYDVKALQKLIVTSRTFRQDSRFDDAALEQDAANVWLARGPRYRLEAEALRDNALAVSGLLDPRIGGPSVFPPQPPGIWTMIYSSDQWVESTGADRYRRGLYTFARRTAPYPTTALFDAPSRETMCARRPRTSTPLQALALLNDPQFVECAVALARRMRREGGASTRDALARGFRLCTARAPEPEELEELARLVDTCRARYAAASDQALALLEQGHGVAAEGEDPAEIAALAVAANVLLNLEETSSLE